VVGRDHGAVEGFKYSDALMAKKGTPWSEEEIYAFLQNPKAWLPGTKMSFAGIAKPEDRANVVAYLASLQ
jgi:cytochrome c